MRNCILLLLVGWIWSGTLPAQSFSRDSIVAYDEAGFPGKGLMYAQRNQSLAENLLPEEQALIYLEISLCQLHLNRQKDCLDWGNKAMEVANDLPTEKKRTIAARYRIILAELAWENSKWDTTQYLTEAGNWNRYLTASHDYHRKWLWANATRRLEGAAAARDSLTRWLADTTLPHWIKLHLQSEWVMGASDENPNTQLDGLNQLAALSSQPCSRIESNIWAKMAEYFCRNRLKKSLENGAILDRALQWFESADYYSGLGRIVYDLKYSQPFRSKERKAATLGVWRDKAQKFRHWADLANLEDKWSMLELEEENFFSALQHGQAANQYLNICKAPHQHRKAQILTNLGILFWKTNQKDTSWKFMRLAEQSYLHPRKPDRLVDLYRNFGVNFLDEEEVDSAAYYFGRSGEYARESEIIEGEFISLAALAICQIKKKQAPSAHSYIRQASTLAQKLGNPNDTYFTLQWIWGEYNALLGNREEAQKHFNLALKAVAPDTNATLAEFPRTATLQLLELKVKAYANSTTLDSHPDFEQILKCCRLAFQISEEAQGIADIGFDGLLKSPSLDFFASWAIKCAEQEYLATQNPVCHRDAFLISEKSRSPFLSRQLKQRKAMVAAGVPDSMIQLIDSLSANLAQLEREVTAGEVDPLSSDEYNTLKTELATLIEDIGKKYPRFPAFMTERIYQNVDSMQAFTRKDNSCIIEYFLDDHTLYTFFIRSDTFIFHSQPFQPDILDTLDAFLSAIREKKTDPGPSLNNYARRSHLLYQILLGPVSHLLTERVTIIPHQRLSRLSLGTLLQPGNQPVSYSSCRFLVERHLFRYHYSGQLLVGQKSLNTTPKKWDFLGFAPGKFNQIGKSYLEGALAEMEHMQTTYRNTQVYLGEDCTYDQFMKEMSQARIVDIATHTTLHPTNSLQTSLHLYGTDKVTLSDLYLSSINADLANLQSCETGLGHTQGDEGFLSLAWGFASAGCRSILMSLWEVDDANVTPEIMEHFYEGLAQGLPKDEALAGAVRKMLERVRNEGGTTAYLASPYYWGELVLVGDTVNIPLGKKCRMEWMVVGMVLLLGLAIGIRRRKRQKKIAPGGRGLIPKG